jgi:RNA polymerase sigma-70 factor, ECF subfamily
MEESKDRIDMQAIEQLFRSDHKKLCNTANRIVNDWDVSQDIVQEVFIKFWNKRQDLKIESSAGAYLLKAVINTCLNYLESSKRQLKLREDISTDHIAKLVYQESTDLEDKELQIRLEMAIEKLPPKCKIIFILCKYEGMKYQQIADHLSISLKTVENQMGIALQKLREDLKAYATREFLVWPIFSILFLQAEKAKYLAFLVF